MYKFVIVIIFFFFFQAEDGIRDGTVTEFRRVLFRSLPHSRRTLVAVSSPCRVVRSMQVIERSSRSEERRVGKECRFGWGVCNYRKKRGEWTGEQRVM